MAPLPASAARRGGIGLAMVALPSPIRTCLLAALLCCLGSRPVHSSAVEVPQTVEYVWPAALFQFPLVPETDDDKFCANLASIVDRGFKRYLEKILPKELEIDPKFKEEFEDRDPSRYSWAFLRWQKRVFSIHARVPVEELNWDGKPVPKYKGISYEWPEFYNSPAFTKLTNNFRALNNNYLKQIAERFEKEKLRIFMWVEPYRTYEFQSPHEHTGAQTAGMMPIRYAPDTDDTRGQRIFFQDPRGAFAPFGRQHEHVPVLGEVTMWPSWLTHYIEPNPNNETNYFMSFLSWPPGGAGDLDWEDDITGDVQWKKMTVVKRAEPKASSSAAASGRDEL